MEVPKSISLSENNIPSSPDFSKKKGEKKYSSWWKYDATVKLLHRSYNTLGDASGSNYMQTLHWDKHLEKVEED